VPRPRPLQRCGGTFLIGQSYPDLGRFAMSEYSPKYLGHPIGLFMRRTAWSSARGNSSIRSRTAFEVGEPFLQ
jgi:hypothetical protein